MKHPKFGVAYSVTGNYVSKSLPSLVSILENNRKCSEEKQVDLKIYFYILDKDDKQIERLQEVCNSYNVELQIIDAAEYIDILKKAGDKEYNDSLVIDLFLIAPCKLDVDYNVLFLQSDVVMNHGHSLADLAQYDFEGGKYSCASTIDPQSSPMVKAVIPLPRNQHLFNCGVFLVSPKLYKEHNTFGQYADSIKERGWKFNVYWNVLRNGYGLRNELSILPVKYQTYPGQNMLKIPQWKKIFGLKNADYYSDEELQEALEDPVFVHYIFFIVNKPWYDDVPRKYRKVGYWPYQDIWAYYADLLGDRGALTVPWNKTYLEKIKRFFYDYLRPLYIPLCTYFYKKDVIKSNNVINSLSDKDRE